MNTFTFLKRTVTNKGVTKNPAVKSTAQLVEEIHEDFFTEVDKLLAEAKISRPLDTDKQDLIDKCERLKRLGFDNAKGMKEAESEMERLNELAIENENKKAIIAAIEYFSVKYPQYKFITEESVKKICDKYGLVYGEISRYTGEVPEKNLSYIERFSIENADKCYKYRKIMLLSDDINRCIGHDEYQAFLEKHNGGLSWGGSVLEEVKESPLEIAAPVSDFDMKGMEIKNFKISKIPVPYPVVLKPIYHGGNKYYLIGTAWGEEASDDMIVNEKAN